MPEVISNEFYQQWGLLGGMAAFAVPLFGLLWQSLRIKQMDITLSELKIKSKLSSSFQLTVLKEVRTVFRLIDDNLFTGLGGEDKWGGPRTRFEHLVEELRKIPDKDKNESEQDQVIGALKETLSDVLIKQTKKLLDDVEIGIADKRTWIDELSNPQPFVFTFDGTTEQALSDVAKKLEQANRRVRWYFRMREITQISLCVIGLVCLLILPAVTLNYEWAEWVVKGCITMLSLGGLLGIFSLVAAYSIKKWLDTEAAVGFSNENNGQVTPGEEREQ